MGYIHCCGALHKTKTFMLVPHPNFTVCELDYLVKCPVCGNLVIQLTRINDKDELLTSRYVNLAARKFWQKVKSKILYEEKFIDYSKYKRGTFYLNYNEFGVKKRCYSNLSNLKIGINSTF
ncbi:hypothetical protein IJ579_06710 [bacterium]|nr:hypothetical protein [bacterium]